MANSVNRYFEGLLVGGTLGFVLGMLTAPKPGAELRRELADSADDMFKQANGNWHDAKDKLSERIQPIADKAGAYKERVASQASVVKSKLGEQTSTLREQAGSMKEKIVEKTSELREKASEKAHELKEKAQELKEKGMAGGTASGGNNADMLNNYMGNNSGPMYTAGHKASPDASATPMSDAGSNFNPSKAGDGAAGG